jgi:two-component system, OmpR family, response regulator
MLPGSIDGIGIVRAIRKEKPVLPIIFLTAKDAISDRVTGLDAGANDYLVKPFAFEELLARVRALTRTIDQQTHDVIVYKELTLNLKTKMLERGDQKLELSKTEFSIIDYMLRNPEIVLSKQNIIDHVWDYDANILPNTVEVFMGMLRNKIDKPFKKHGLYIQTIRGFGYKLEHKK